jgi:hypothetical protein
MPMSLVRPPFSELSYKILSSMISLPQRNTVFGTLLILYASTSVNAKISNAAQVLHLTQRILINALSTILEGVITMPILVVCLVGRTRPLYSQSCIIAS